MRLIGACPSTRRCLSSALGSLAVVLAANAPTAWALRPPAAYTGEAARITVSSAELKGSVFPEFQPTSYYFQYGPTSSYGLQTPLVAAGAGPGPIHVTAVISALSAGASYHFRLVVVNSSGTGLGADRQFATKKIPLTFAVSATPTRVILGSLFSVSGTLTGTGAAGHLVVLQGNPFPYLSPFEDVAPPQLTDGSGGFSFTMPSLPRSTELRVATLDTPPSVSRVMLELVAVRVTLHVRATGRPGFARLFGTVAPRQLAALVLLQRLDRRRGPVTAASAVTVGGAAASSRFSRVVRIRRPGLYRALALVSGAQVSGASHVVKID